MVDYISFCGKGAFPSITHPIERIHYFLKLCVLILIMIYMSWPLILPIIHSLQLLFKLFSRGYTTFPVLVELLLSFSRSSL